MTENQSPSGRSGRATRTAEPSWGAAEGENAATLEDGRDDELDTERDDAVASGTTYTPGSVGFAGFAGSVGSDEDEAEDLAADETDESHETEADEAEGAEELGRPAGYGETAGYDDPAAAEETTGYGASAEGVGNTEDPDMTGYLPAYREPAAAEPEAVPEAEPGAIPGWASTTPTAPGAEPGPPTGPAVPAFPIPGSTVAVAVAVEAEVEAAAAATSPAATQVAGEHSGRMREIQLGFVDDPRHAALEAQELLIDALQSLTEESVRERDGLRGSADETNPDTERMRLAVRRARELIDAVSSTY